MEQISETEVLKETIEKSDVTMIPGRASKYVVAVREQNSRTTKYDARVSITCGCTSGREERRRNDLRRPLLWICYNDKSVCNRTT